jgi:hypothetical protein
MSLIWQIGLYKKLKDDMVECLVCKPSDSSNRVFKCKSGTTTPLITHLKKHPEYQEKFDKLKETSSAANPKIREFLSGLTFF